MRNQISFCAILTLLLLSILGCDTTQPASSADAAAAVTMPPVQTTAQKTEPADATPLGANATQLATAQPTTPPQPSAQPSTAQPTLSPTEPPATVAPTIAPTAAPETQSAAPRALTIGEILLRDGRFSAFADVVDSANLTPILNRPDAGPFTLFAPTSGAFDNLPASINLMLADSSAAGLADVVRQHVLDGNISSVDLLKLQSATNLAGDTITLNVNQNVVTLNGTIVVVTTDIEASNGTIHVIDDVLLANVALSDAFSAEQTAAQPSPTPTTAPEDPTLAEILNTAGRFDSFLNALTNAKLIDAFTDPRSGPYTIFAPTDVAFAALPQDVLDTLIADPDGALRDVLRYHMLPGRVPSGMLAEESAVIPLSRDLLTIHTLDDDSIVFNRGTRVTGSDIRAVNGVIHIVDHVLLPPIISEDGAAAAQDNGAIDIIVSKADTSSFVTAPNFEPITVAPSATILDVLAQTDSLSQIATLLNSANLLTMLEAPNNAPITLFAPTNDALDMLDADIVNQLLTNQEQLAQLLSNHIIAGANPSDQLVSAQPITAQSGQSLTFTRYGNLIVINDTVRILQTDIQTSNGIIHIIDTLITE